MWLIFVAVIVLSAVGLWNALYFSLVMHGKLSPDSKIVPGFCRPEESTCRRVTDTPSARVFFGVPNADWGIAFYAVLIIWSVWWFVTGDILWPDAVQIASAFAVGLSVYLAFVLIFRLKMSCPFCFLGQGINVALAMLIWAVLQP